ncbi:MAG: cbb3-type cytochrome c oxidase subunit I [Solirubrobacterales bacterium]
MEAGTARAGAMPATATIEEARVRALVARYFYATTAIFLVAGALGVVMRQSQADIFPIEDNFFYAAMTAHGLGTFMAWGAFAVMGFGFWVLARSGFEMRPLGYRLADATWWVTVVGTAGIVVTTLLMGFAGSWVFLYPLPFFSAGQWGDAATGIFAFSVLLVGVGILTWCTAILHTVAGPSNPSERGGALNRIAVGLGIGIVFPRLFPVRGGETPYPVIPLTVIAVDMLIATLPLAALLVIMIAQVIDPSITVDPLLAKNMLWFFGHPVVYLLLFPAVAVYYLLIPQYAKRPLAAANVIGIAWVIGVIANVIIWAHHMYLDYPADTFQSVINVAMQPLTFSITLVSAISVYSLCATMYKSDFEWNPASGFLIAGLIGWFTAGLSGVVNATIALNVDVHNTLWIVGHFHHMALLNIGAVIFGAAYAFVPELIGKRWYSQKLGWWHLWLTMIGGYGNSIIWYIQGLNGGPRRFSVLPESYDALSQLTLPFVVLVALGQLVFAYNVIQTMRGRRRANDDKPVLADTRQIGLVTGALALAVLVPGFLVALDRLPDREPVQAAAPGPEKALSPEAQAGEELFTTTCGSCHAFSAAGTSGGIGPDLDSLPLTQERVLAAIENGGTGSGQMPANLLSGADATAVAKYLDEAGG